MKKILFFALMLTVAQLGAQNKEADAALKAYEKSKADVAGKKALDAASWLKLGNNIVNIYDLPTKNIWQGLSAPEAKVVLKDQRSSTPKSVTLNGETYDLVSYPDKDLYYTPNGALAFWMVTKPLLPQNLLIEAFEAYKKAYELDTKGTQKKALAEGVTKVQQFFIQDAMTANSLGNYSLSSENFGNSILCAEHPLINRLDTIVVFYTGYTAFYAQEYARAVTYFQRSLNMGYSQEGAAYSYLAECYKVLNQPEKIEPTLAEGFTKFPSNQGILVTLINLYTDNDEDPSKIMEYIHFAQSNEPNNESLYQAEGNIWKRLNNNEKAIECFKKSVAINPNYLFGQISIGTYYYEIALELQDLAAEEMDDKKYDALCEEMDQMLLQAAGPLEAAYTLSASSHPDLQIDIAAYLKSVYYRLQSKDEKYVPLHDKYNNIVQQGR